jgi:phenylacetate-CoA ligase
LSKEFCNRVFLYAETSGSTGSSTPSFFTRKDFDGLISLSSLSPYIPLIKKELSKNRTAVNGLTFGFTIAGFSFGSLLQKHGALVAQLGTRSTIAMPSRTADTIVKLMPSTISATPIDFMSWIEIIRTDYPKEFKDIIENIKFLFSTAEPCAKSRQNQIEKCSSITHINTYASVDGFVSIPCPCGEMHIINDLYDIGLFDSNMNYIGQKGIGRLCFTGLFRKTTPMVKYLLDDLVTLYDSRCNYGFKTSIKPHGRYELSIDINGTTLGNLDFEEIIYKYGLFMDYHVEITNNLISIKLEKYPLASDNYKLNELKDEVENLTRMKCLVESCPIGILTNIRDVRKSKSVVKIVDIRINSRQEIPQIL